MSAIATRTPQPVASDFQLFDFSEEDELRILATLPETFLQYLQHRQTEMAQELMDLQFSADPVTREQQILQYNYATGKRDFLIELLVRNREAKILLLQTPTNAQTA